MHRKWIQVTLPKLLFPSEGANLIGPAQLSIQIHSLPHQGMLKGADHGGEGGGRAFTKLFHSQTLTLSYAILIERCKSIHLVTLVLRDDLWQHDVILRGLGLVDSLDLRFRSLSTLFTRAPGQGSDSLQLKIWVRSVGFAAHGPHI